MPLQRLQYLAGGRVLHESYYAYVGSLSFGVSGDLLLDRYLSICVGLQLPEQRPDHIVVTQVGDALRLNFEAPDLGGLTLLLVVN